MTTPHIHILLGVSYTELKHFINGQDGFDAENEEFDSLQSEELLSVANVIDKLSVQANNHLSSNEDDDREDNDCVKDITNNAIRKTLEENEDLKRQNILLEQQLGEKERRIKALGNVFDI